MATIALATSLAPEAALAKKAAKTAKKTTRVAQVLDTLAKYKDAIQLSDAGKLGGTFVAGTLVAVLGKKVFGKKGTKPTVQKIQSVFPGALKNKVLVSKVATALKQHDYRKSTTLLATSLDVDPLTRVLERDFRNEFDSYNFHMGGLAGFPFGGVTSFGAMASHIPDGGSCLVVFAPHVGVDASGAVGTVERRGRSDSGPCCRSSIAAMEQVLNGEKQKPTPSPDDPQDAQQLFVENMLLPYADRLEQSADTMVELPYVMYKAQKNMMMDIVKAGAGNVADGKIAVLGGIQINTPAGVSDYFKPLSFEVYDNKGQMVEDLMGAL